MQTIKHLCENTQTIKYLCENMQTTNTSVTTCKQPNTCIKTCKQPNTCVKTCKQPNTCVIAHKQPNTCHQWQKHTYFTRCPQRHYSTFHFMMYICGSHWQLTHSMTRNTLLFHPILAMLSVTQHTQGSNKWTSLILRHKEKSCSTKAIRKKKRKEKAS